MLPKATHGSIEHPLKIGDVEIPCYVLEDGRRVLSLGGMVKALGMSIGSAGGGEGDRLASFVAGKAISPFVSNDLASRMKSPVRFQAPTGGTAATGYEATILADLCEALLAARQAAPQPLAVLGRSWPRPRINPVFARLAHIRAQPVHSAQPSP